MKLFKFELLITQCTVNVEREFSALSLSHIPERNYFSVASLDCSIRNLMNLNGNSSLIISETKSAT